MNEQASSDTIQPLKVDTQGMPSRHSCETTFNFFSFNRNGGMTKENSRNHW